MPVLARAMTGVGGIWSTGLKEILTLRRTLYSHEPGQLLCLTLVAALVRGQLCSSRGHMVRIEFHPKT